MPSPGLIAAALGNYGDKPVIPDLPQLYPGAEQQQTITNNQAALPGAGQLAHDTNQFNVNELYSILPNSQGMIQKGNQNISDWEHGYLPPDVADAIQRNSAYKSGVMGGFGGSQAAGDLTARDLGLTSLDLMQKGTQMAPGVLQGEKSLFNLMDPQSLYMTPMQTYGIDSEETMKQYRNQLLKNQVAAAPSPEDLAWNSAWANLDHWLMNVGGGAMGSMGAGNTDAPSSGGQGSSTDIGSSGGDMISWGGGG